MTQDVYIAEEDRCEVVVCSLFYVKFCSYYVAPGDEFQGQSMGEDL